jgi:hypothetical protein
MRLRLAVLIVLALSLIAYAPLQAQTSTGGIVEIWLKARESVDAPNDQKVTLYQKSKALVIGMDHYSAGWPQLSNGIKDAEEVAKALTAQGFEVTLKKDLKSDDLERTLKSFFIVQGDDPNARLLLWYAGHGDTINDEAYLVPVDAPLPSRAGAEFRTKAISLRRFGEYMREANARHVIALFDSCFSGGVFNVARSAPPPAITLATTQPVREFISSGEADQQVSDDGTFRKLFLDVLAGKEPDADANHDGYVTGTELGLFMHQKMTNLTNNRQTPRYGKLNVLGYDRGDFVFQVGKPEVPTTAVPTTQPTNDAAQAWAAIKDTKSSVIVEIFLRRYGDGFYGDLARARLEGLKNEADHSGFESVKPSTNPTATGRPIPEFEQNRPAVNPRPERSNDGFAYTVRRTATGRPMLEFDQNQPKVSPQPKRSDAERNATGQQRAATERSTPALEQNRRPAASARTQQSNGGLVYTGRRTATGRPVLEFEQKRR